MEVSWNEVPCYSRNGDIIAYKYDFNLVGSRYHYPLVTTIGRRVTINDLQCATEYGISVAGVTNVGVGVFSKSYVWRTNTTGMYYICMFRYICKRL